LRLEVDHVRPSAVDLEHLSRCRECTAHRALLAELQSDLLESRPSPPTEVVLARVQERARAALWAGQRAPVFRRETFLPLVLALFALPLAVVQGWLWLQGLHFLMEAWLPFPVLAGISILYIGSVSIGLGLLYASIPIALAYSRRIEAEAT
ncbi:MAG: hypothetical protein VCC04_04500, partial [Myxococcota bacterium]